MMGYASVQIIEQIRMKYVQENMPRLYHEISYSFKGYYSRSKVTLRAHWKRDDFSQPYGELYEFEYSFL